MKKLTKVLFVLFFLFLTLFFYSCTKADISITSSDIRPFVTSTSRMGVSFWLHINGYDSAKTIELNSPDGEYTWHLDVTTTDYKGIKYLGSANAVMPIGVDLPQGQWSYVIVFKDGRNYEGKFNIYYRDKEGALQRSESAGLPYYDTKANLTVIFEEIILNDNTKEKLVQDSIEPTPEISSVDDIPIDSFF